MSRIATGTGDQGQTGLADGSRLPKDHARVQADRAVDDLNSALGLCLALRQDAALERVQRELFDLGADLSLAKGGPRITPEHVARLDAELDALERALPPLTNFILPGGSEAAARLHHARTVCRRAERALVTMGERGQALVYLNRLGDLLFLLARQVNRDAGAADVKVRF
ncbi:MAG: cob(I)yrinic acid a,c-diamide adenosyltransferase [Halobacteriales archaeon]|nr:cob(I)yrinic acid a,c-diamide adenosyltransferase [Halobacteriales archaeon]